MTPIKPRAIGIVRVSRVGDRRGPSFVSPSVQKERITELAKREGYELISIGEELDVSGGKPLAERPELSRAVQAIESGSAEAVLVAYFDRAFRSLKTQTEVMERIAAAGGKIAAADVGEISAETSMAWLNATQHGLFAEYLRRQVSEKSVAAVASRIADGVYPAPIPPTGYRKGADGRLEPDSSASAVTNGFAMRADGATVKEIQSHLNERGANIGFHATTKMLKSRVYLGELHHGKHEPNLKAHPALVDRQTFEDVQRRVISRGRRAKSDRLLARQHVLRCACCGSLMTVTSTGTQSNYPGYRCPPANAAPCVHKPTISATKVERYAEDIVKSEIAGMRGRATTSDAHENAQIVLDAAQTRLHRFIRLMADMQDEHAAREQLAQLRSERDEARRELDQMQSKTALIVDPSVNWDLLTLDERRDLVRLIIDRIEVKPGRIADRLSYTLR